MPSLRVEIAPKPRPTAVATRIAATAAMRGFHAAVAAVGGDEVREHHPGDAEIPTWASDAMPP